jgi:hypothetical protein
MRRYAQHFEGPNKSRKELGVVERLVESMELAGEPTYHGARSSQADEDPPDCIAYDVNNAAVAFEVTEFVSGDAVRMNEQGHHVYRDWTPPDAIREIERLLVEKDSKSYKGGPYAQIVLVIHTTSRRLRPRSPRRRTM